MKTRSLSPFCFATMLLLFNAGSLVAGPSARQPLGTKESASLREEAQTALGGGDLAKVADLLERSRSVTNPAERAAWWLVESEYEYARRAWSRSALAALRVVTLHPKSEQAGPALYWAARAYEQLGRPLKAADLYRECLANKHTPSGLREAAKARLAELQPAAKTP